ncbi:MAG: exo-alpha-sialidase [Cyclobacteriaceae bacterium]|nr:exo-alpha-sialidase [Cyclobacteriaceae bacterium]
MQTKLLAGTSKGLVVFENINGWKISSIHFEGLPISFIYIDERSNTWWTGISHRHWGEKLHRSQDEGKHWEEIPVPNYNNALYQPEKPASLKKIWVIQHGGDDKPNSLWLGTEPGGLFHSTNNGKSFELVESLWNHPSRRDPSQWFGAGKDYPFIHSIVLDPIDSNHLYVGVSCAGVFESADLGKTWSTRNSGLIAAYLPDPKAEAGHDPHKILLCKDHPEVMWQQNHCGIFRSINGGKQWEDVSDPDGFPKYGFALIVDDHDPLTAWVIPAHSDEQRIPVDLRLVVCKTSDGGKNWITLTNGLPEESAFDLVLRHSFAKKEDTLSFGTNNGNLYISEDKGDSWKNISHHLAMINCVTFN